MQEGSMPLNWYKQSTLGDAVIAASKLTRPRARASGFLED
jgi:hypothetical protein